jgi:hypothetical protein
MVGGAGLEAGGEQSGWAALRRTMTPQCRGFRGRRMMSLDQSGGRISTLSLHRSGTGSTGCR